VNLQTAGLAAECIVPISRRTREDYLRIFPRSAARLAPPIYNIVSTTTLEPTVVRGELGSLNLVPQGYILGFGLGGKRKGNEIAFKAYSLYRQNGGTLPLVLIGGKDLDLAAMGLSLSDAPMVLGRVGDRMRDSLYAGAVCLLFFSRCEGFGYPMVEAARQGCPSVAWSQTTASEIFEGTIPLMRHLSSKEGAELIGYYEGIDSEQRSKLRTRLIARSEFFRRGDFGARFSQAINAALQSKRTQNPTHV
jgi:glycosyltransferase involved in cell wall biosynthesis